MTKIGARNVGYWINAVAEGEEDYYTRPGEEPGRWAGSLAPTLGLAGEVDAEEYAAIFAGTHPRSGVSLLRRPEPEVTVDAAGKKHRSEPVLGFDVRFSAPKSVSLIWAIGGEEARAVARRAHDAAVEAAVAYLERNACFVRRGKGGRRFERGTGFIGMGFLHRTSRAGDPALHTHMLISNLTRAESDGKWLSLAAPRGRMPLWIEAKTAGHIYQAVLRAEITREAGLEWGEVRNGYADLLLLTRDQIEHFSRRRAEIVERMAELGVHSAAAAEVAALRTREEKEYGVDIDDQRADWRARAAEFGLDEESIDAALAFARSREPVAISHAETDAALADLEEHQSHFCRRDLICALASQMQEGAGGAELEGAVDALLADRRLVEIHHGEAPVGNSFYTTRRLWEMENRVVHEAVEGAGAGASVINDATLAVVLARHHYLGDEQAEMVSRLTTGGERVIAVAALPGTGKTTALKAAAEGWGAGGFRGIGLATARSATNEISDVGLPATSIAKLLMLTSERTGRGLDPLPPGTVVVVDEASTMATPHAAALLDLVRACDGKLVLIGDPRQIGSVGPGGIYGHLTRRLEPVVLSEIRRQHEEVDREIVRLAHEGRGSDALDVLDAAERLRIADTHDEALTALALDWHRSFATGEDAVMVARRNDDVERLNEMARAFRAEHGGLGEAITVDGREFAVGDRVMTRVNTPLVSNRERWEVVEVDRARESISVRRLGGEEGGAVLGREYLERTTAEGDAALQRAYAMTTYAAQGKTFEEAYVLLDPGISREDFLVAISRSRGRTVAFGVSAPDPTDRDLGPVEKEVDDPRYELRDGAERVAGEYPAVEVDARRRVEALGPAELARRRVELARGLADAGRPSPAARRLEALDQRIGSARARLDSLADERAGAGDPDAARRAATLERQTRTQLGRLEADRVEVAHLAETEPTPRAREMEARFALRLVEERMVQLRRMHVAAERVVSTEVVHRALGPYPRADPHRALVWDEGADLIHGFRVRHGITAADGDPLGPRSGDEERRQERRIAEERLARIRGKLGHVQARTADRTLEVGL